MIGVNVTTNQYPQSGILSHLNNTLIVRKLSDLVSQIQNLNRNAFKNLDLFQCDILLKALFFMFF